MKDNFKLSFNLIQNKLIINNQFYANGKLLLTGEYFVLDGATSIALPCQHGQSLEVMPYQEGTLHWRSYDVNKEMWLEVIILTKDWKIIHTNDPSAAERLIEVLQKVVELSPSINLHAGFNIWTRLGFDRSWGLGSSSTMLSLIAQWTGVDAYRLALETFGGSGYDIACARADGPITYQRTANDPLVSSITFNPPYKDHLCFVHLGAKKDTQEALKMYADIDIVNKQSIQKQIAEINDRIIYADSISTFTQAIEDHEELISNHLGLTKVKDQRFSDFEGSIKSLGAWGGDFVLAASPSSIDRTTKYFIEKGYPTIIAWDEMILS